jgi:hypothetical protein
MSGLECHLIRIAESWLGLAGEADRIQALMDPFEPVIPEIQTWTVAKADQKELEGHSPSLDWYARTPLSAFGWRRKLALRCISIFLTEIAERWVREPILPGRSGRVRKRRAADGKLSEVS